MSTIAGIIRRQGDAVSQDDTERLLQALAIYRPEVSRAWRRNQAALVSSLRRFTPEDVFDRQPLNHGGNKPVLVFSGRLDNRDELAQKLQIPAAQVRNMADSALVLSAHEAWGEESPRHLLGDFAFAVWSPLTECLFLARDPMGMRPLYWHQGQGFFAFASAAQALHALPQIPRELDEERLAEYLALIPWVGPATCFLGIQRLEPGHSLIMQNGSVRTTCYHRFSAERRIELPRDEDYVEAFRAHLEAAVRCRLRARGEIGAHLSSGFDSSTVCAVTAPMLAERNRKLLAFTHVPREGFDGPTPRGRHANEGPAAAALAARHPNMDHILIRSDERHLSELDRHSQHSSRPLLNPSNALWISAIRNEAVARGARVVLTGQWGNMGLSFDGRMLLPALLRQGRPWAWLRESHALYRQGVMNGKSILSQSLGPFMPEWLWSRLSRQRRGDLSGLFRLSALHPDVAHALDIRARAEKGKLRLSYRPWHDGRAARLMVLYRVDLGDSYLDTLAQAGVVERDPTADVRLLEFCLAIPENQFLRNGQMRWLLHRAYGDRLPPEILHARSKGLQSADWYETASRERKEMAAELDRLEASPTAARLLDLKSMRQAVDHWPTTGWTRQEVISEYKLKLLRGLSVGMFIRKMEGGNE
jgi:asparagine synthase (glutamine-hydrolysing)